MSRMSSLLGYPFELVQLGVTIALALIFGAQAQLKMRPYLLAIQAGLGGILIGRFAATLVDDGLAPMAFLTNVLSVNFGVMLSHFFVCWIIVILVFFLRFRSHNARIFTRNRDQ